MTILQLQKSYLTTEPATFSIGSFLPVRDHSYKDDKSDLLPLMCTTQQFWGIYGML